MRAGTTPIRSNQEIYHTNAYIASTLYGMVPFYPKGCLQQSILYRTPCGLFIPSSKQAKTFLPKRKQTHGRSSRPCPNFLLKYLISLEHWERGKTFPLFLLFTRIVPGPTVSTLPASAPTQSPLMIQGYTYLK